MTRPEFSTSLADFPFFHNPSERLSNQGYTAVIEMTGPPTYTSLIKLIKSLSQAARLKVVWYTYTCFTAGYSITPIVNRLCCCQMGIK